MQLDSVIITLDRKVLYSMLVFGSCYSDVGFGEVYEERVWGEYRDGEGVISTWISLKFSQAS